MDDLLDFDGSVINTGRGGARPGAGRKPAGYIRPDDAVSYDKAKARKEVALADLHELDYKVKSGQYVARAAVRQAAATALAVLAQTLRSLPDNLERRGIEASVCAQIDAVVTDVLADAGRALQEISFEADAPNNEDLF